MPSSSWEEVEKESVTHGLQFLKIEQIKIRTNNSNHILALRFTTNMLLPGWDSKTTFVRAETAFLPLVAALAVVLEEGGEGDCNPGPQFLKLVE